MKKNMKRAAALTLSAVMATGLLAGCGGDDGAAGSTAAGNDSAGGVVDTSEHVDLKLTGLPISMRFTVRSTKSWRRS